MCAFGLVTCEIVTFLVLLQQRDSLCVLLSAILNSVP